MGKSFLRRVATRPAALVVNRPYRRFPSKPCPGGIGTSVNDEPFPERYRFLAVHAYERGELGDSDLAHYLRCDIIRAREIAALTRSSREVEPATGETRAWRLNLDQSLLGEVR